MPARLQPRLQKSLQGMPGTAGKKTIYQGLPTRCHLPLLGVGLSFLSAFFSRGAHPFDPSFPTGQQLPQVEGKGAVKEISRMSGVACSLF